MKKVLYFLFALGFIIWFGGSIVRNVIIFDLFVPAQELTFEPKYDDSIINYNIELYVATSLYTNVSYAVIFVISLILLYSERRNLRQHGWLFMSFIVFFIASPIIIYNIYLDLGLSFAIFYHDFSFLNYGIKTEIFNRYKSNLNTVLSGISYLSTITILFYIIWKPLKNPNDKT
ncbi:hypothetical protein MASR1M45_05260 [Candidatus Kapaibacterium sp.]